MAREPYRVFFPAGVLAGVIGVLLWPLYFSGAAEFYPGVTHPRIMTCGMFGAFIFGFLGTAMPRMLSTKPFRLAEIIPLLCLHLAMVIAYAVSKIFLGDLLFLALIIGFLICLALRIKQRKDIPPPGFVLVGLSFLCVLTATILALIPRLDEADPFWITLQRLLLYQGFVLLPILGIGPFLLPRFMGMPNRHDFPESLAPSRAWMKKAFFAFLTGAMVIVSFFIEAARWQGLAYSLRFLAALAYFYCELPLHQAPKARNTIGFCIRLSLVGLLSGFLTIPFFPAYRVTLLHLTLMGGFAILTFVVATRVVFGHSGNLERLKGGNRWLIIAVGLMLVGMATRMSGDFWPKLMVSHYVYGAILWIAGTLLWAVYVLPKALVADSDEEKRPPPALATRLTSIQNSGVPTLPLTKRNLSQTVISTPSAK